MCLQCFHELWAIVAGEQTNGGSRRGASILLPEEVDHFCREDRSVSLVGKHFETASGEQSPNLRRGKN